MKPIVRPFAVVAASLLLLAGCMPTYPTVHLPWISVTPSAAPVPAQLQRFYHQSLKWQPCSEGECTTLQVPLDYGHPEGSTIGIAVFRSRASDSGQRIGSLLLNPGGPGASGVEFARAAGQFFPVTLRQRFDLVGFDPRGVGDSAPVRCLTDAQLDAYTQQPAYPVDAQQQASIVAMAQGQARACQERNASTLAHLSTADEARDMDVLRGALGDDRLNFYGASYGTFLGSLYAEQFPTHVRALVLDSALDPARTSVQDDLQQAQSFEQLLQLFLSYCVRSGSCPLGGSLGAAQTRLDQFLAQVAQHPLPGSGPRVAGSGPVLTAIASAMYAPPVGFPQLEKALAAGLAGDGSQLLSMADEQNGRDASGHYTNLIDANTAINCVDRPRARTVQAYADEAARAAAVAPHFGASSAWGALSCAFWPVQAQLQPHRVHDPGAPPVLIVAARYDPATPHQWGVALSHELNGAVVLTLNSAIHGSFARGAPCIDNPVVTYLTTLKLPPQGSVCQP